MDVYGSEPRELPHTLSFVARPRSSPRPASKTLNIQNVGGGALGQIDYEVKYLDLENWLFVTPHGEGNQQELELSVTAKGKKPKDGVYRAVVEVHCPGGENSPQSFGVKMLTPSDNPASEVVVDDQDAACHLSPYYWLTPRIHSSGIWQRGENGSFSVAAGIRSIRGWATYRPDLAAGRYRVAIADNAPIRPTDQAPSDVALNVTVRHRLGTQTLRIAPSESREIGIFEFAEGAHGFVRLEMDQAEGTIVADAVSFTKIADLAAETK
jgi:hypothetical protein